MNGLMKKISIATGFAILVLVKFALPVRGTVIIPESGSITIHKYELSGDNDESLPGTGLAQEAPEGTEPLSGISFQVVRVLDNTTEVNGAEPFTGEGSYSQTETTNASGLAVFTSLPFGVYLVTELENPLVEEPVLPFLVRIPMTNPTGTQLIYDVHVYPKNRVTAEDLSIDKNIYDAATDTLIKDTSVDIGATITWYISVGVPQNIGAAKQFQVVDSFGELMDYTGGSLTVTLIHKDGSEEVIINGSTTYYDLTPEDGKLTITFSGDGREKLGAAAAEAGEGTVTLEISLETVLNGKAADFLGEEIGNGAYIVYENAVNKTYTPEVQNTPYVITGGVVILKQNEGGEYLAGAKFKIYGDEQSAREQGPAITAPGSSQEWEITTDGTGKATFAGLSFGDYWVVETQAPPNGAGGYYNLLLEPVPVSLQEEEAVVELRIANSQDGPGFVLPVTGGRGTILLTIAGIALIGVGIVVFIIPGKRKNEGREEE